MVETLQGLRIRKLADKSSGERVKRFDPVTGESYLVDPNKYDLNDSSTHVSEPWPFLGVVPEGDLPKRTAVSTSFVNKGVAEGFITLEGREVVHRPGGPVDDPWRVTHTFVQADAVVFHFMDGDVRYRVVNQPDKYPAEKNEFDEGFGGEVNWFFELELEGTVEEDNG